MKKIKAALISVFYKDGLEPIAQTLHASGVTIYSTGGTQTFLEQLGIPCVAVESVTDYPSILGGRVKTLHPKVFGGILGKRNDAVHQQEMKQYEIPEIDLVIVDLYPFEETVKSFGDKTKENETSIIEKIDIGGPSMIRAAAKNHTDVVVLAAKSEYENFWQLLQSQDCSTSLEQRRDFARKAFDVCSAYDNAISNYFNDSSFQTIFQTNKRLLRYGENPHQSATFHGNLDEVFTQLNGKELSYNNLVDVDAAIQLMNDLNSIETAVNRNCYFAIIKHTNVCGVAAGVSLKQAWDLALAGDPESAFGGVLVCNQPVDAATATAINELFFEVLVAPDFEPEALLALRSKKNRILLQVKPGSISKHQYKSVLNGVLVQQADEGNFKDWNEVGGRECNIEEKLNLIFANIICKNLKSNAIAIVKNGQMIGKGCGQTSRIDALKHAIEKAKQFNFDCNGAVLASDAFFPFDDCIRIAHASGMRAFIQPGGSIRDEDSVRYAKENELAMVITGQRHFKH